ncbi:hypothetical protein DL766_007680 [Monosporascus sp. MC13-8B]|nr:hypothetical protein DL763_005759 [Monosporascus cannonballus]RYP22626.1 hypothetical protein DL766_007680 [Monosporascus sp. MC13-8B]
MVLENLARTARKLGRGQKRARAQKLSYEAATWSCALAEQPSTWREAIFAQRASHADALFIEGLLDEHANLIVSLETISEQMNKPFNAISSHTAKLVSVGGK